VDAASDGDVLLVKHRSSNARYGSFTIRRKTLVVVGEPDPTTPGTPGNVPATGPVWIRDLTPDQTVVIRGIAAYSLGGETAPTLQIGGCQGSVLIEDGLFVRDGEIGVAPPAALPSSLFIIDSPSVTCSRSAARGENGYMGTVAGGAAVAVDVGLFLHNTTLVGGEGAVVNALVAGGQLTPTTGGGDGLLMSGGFAYAVGGFISGGSGGDGIVDALAGCVTSSNGGSALRLLAGIASNPRFRLLDVDIVKGTGGRLAGPGCPAGADGLEHDIQAGSVSLTVGRAHAFVAHAESLCPPGPMACPDSPRLAVREGESAELRFRGSAGEQVFLLIGDLAPPTGARIAGPLHINPIREVRPMGTLTDGELRALLPIGELGAGVEAVPVQYQAIFFSPSTRRVTASDPSLLVLLDRAF